MSETRRFLDLLYPPGTCDGFLSIWFADDSSSIHVPVDLPGIERGVQEEDSAGRPVYFGCCLRREDLGSKKRGSRQDLTWLPGFWLDIDIAGPAHKAGNLPPDQATVAEILSGFEHEPTAIVDSGYGLHVWWLFARPEKITDVKLLQAQARTWHERLAKLFEARGYHLDYTSDLSRVLRLPGTTNRKIAGQDRAVTLLASDGPRYDKSLLDRWLGIQQSKLSSLLGAIRAQTQPSSDAPAVDAPPPKVDTRTDEEVLEALWAKLNKLRNPEQKAFFSLVKAGKPFATTGGRDSTLQRIASVIAFSEPNARPELLATVLIPSLNAMGLEEGAPTIDQAIDKIARAQSDARAKEEQARRRLKRLEDLAIRQARRNQPAPAETPTPSTALAVAQAPAPVETENDAPEERTGHYTAEEIAEFARSQNCEADEFKTRWVIQHGTAHWVFVAGRYESPIGKDDLFLSLPRDLAPLPPDYFEWTVARGDNPARPKTTQEILKDLGTNARKIVSNLALQSSYYDPFTQTFHESVCPIRESLTPEYHSEIDQWLRLLGGSDAERLLDWIATVTQLSHQSCALYLSGVPGSGKSMLATGLARLWTTGAPTELGRILVGGFNSDLTNCPLVVADEHLGSGFQAATIKSTDLRQLVGRSTQTLSRKYLPNSSLEGALRLMLLANNNRLLNTGDEELDTNDLDAVASRFLHIETDDAPKKFLAALGGRTGTDGWVQGDKIARHALWLRDNRTVVPGIRFLVEGRVGAVQHQLAVQGETSSLVVEWLARFLDQHSAPNLEDLRRRKFCLVGNGRYLVNTSAITNYWDQLVKVRPPLLTTSKVGRALANLSKGTTFIDGVRYNVVRHDLVISWADQNQVGDPDRLRALVAKQGKT